MNECSENETLRSVTHLSPPLSSLSSLSLSLSLADIDGKHVFRRESKEVYVETHHSGNRKIFRFIKSLYLSISLSLSISDFESSFPLKSKCVSISTAQSVTKKLMHHFGTPDFISIGFRGLRFHFKSCSRLKGGETYHDKHKHKHKQTFRFDSQFIRLVSIFFLCRNGLSLSRRGGSRKPKKNLSVSFKKEMRSSSSYMARRPLGTCGFKAGYNLTQ